jgi:hypothetical protein
MKVGIISLYGWLKLWDNYGTLLQNYALQEYLRRNGHDTFWIRTRSIDERVTNKRSLVPRLIQSLRDAAVYLLRPLRGKPRSSRLAEFAAMNPRHFGEFMTSHIPTTPVEYTYEELRESPPAADAYVVGSDQVWKYATPMNFLDFGPPESRRIAYAVSAPWPLLDDEWIASARLLVKRIDAVAVREVDGLPVCRKLERPDALQVVDPTLLLEAADYRQLVENSRCQLVGDTPQVLGYFVNLNKITDVPWNAILGAVRDRRATYKVVPLQGSELVVPAEYVFAPTPTGWIRAFDRAECVVTNSFHGALFAVIMRRPFLVFLQTGATEAENCRFFSALDPLGLADRIVPSEAWRDASARTVSDWMNRSVDWEKVQEKLTEMRDRSTNYLLSALAG